MNKLLSLGLNDIKNVFREQILTVIFTLFPILNLVAAVWLVPMLGDTYPEVIPYYPLILTFMILQVGMGIGFVVAAFFLEEKDQQLLDVLKTIPLNGNTFLSYRLAFGMIYMFGFSLLLINLSPLIEVSPWQSLLMSFLLILPTPLITLLMAIFAGNKVEGLAIFKGINLVLLLPAAAFAIEGPWKHAFGIVPIHWIFQYVDAAANASPGETVFLLAAFLYALGAVASLIYLFRKKVF